jgi:hypothetical protein
MSETERTTRVSRDPEMTPEPISYRVSETSPELFSDRVLEMSPELFSDMFV